MPTSQSLQSTRSDLWASSSESSDQYTSASTSASTSPPPPRPRPVPHDPDAARVPRRVERARESLYNGILCVLAILRRRDVSWRWRDSRGCQSLLSEIYDPWKELSKSLRGLKTGLEDARSAASPCFQESLRVLMHLCGTHIVTLARDKRYAREHLSKSGAKAIPSVIKHYQGVREMVRIEPIDEDHARMLQLCPLEILARITALALPPPTFDIAFLDLSSLPYYMSDGVLEQMQELQIDVPRLVELFGVHRITHLSLAGNDIERLPRWICLPGLVGLDVSNNSQLHSAPLRLLTLPLDTIDIQSTELAAKGRVYAPKREALVKARVCMQSLVAASLVKLRSIAHEDYDEAIALLPPQTLEMVQKSYVCDVCDKLVLPSDDDTGGTVEVCVRSDTFSEICVDVSSKQVQAIRLSGRACPGCRRRFFEPVQ